MDRFKKAAAPVKKIFNANRDGDFNPNRASPDIRQSDNGILAFNPLESRGGSGVFVNIE